MKKLIRGIIDFRTRVLPNCRHKFAELAKGQNPDTLFITCSDSRVAPNWFASTDPGDLFVIRNVGNLISPCGKKGITSGDESELAAVEFALLALKVSDIIICGHSECGAMGALANNETMTKAQHLQSWLRHGMTALERLNRDGPLDPSLSRVNQLSQLNVLTQLEHLSTYPLVQEKLQAQTLRLHGWWFDIADAGIYSYQENQRRFVLIPEDFS